MAQMAVQSRFGYQAYIICTSPRSGSTLLCRLLAATGVAGRPESYFHVPTLAAWQKSLNLQTVAYEDKASALKAVFNRARSKGMGESNLFGLRLQRKSASFFFEQLEYIHSDVSGDLARFEAEFGKTCIVHLTRQDKLAQAISLIKAMQTGLWHKAPDGTELERTSEPQEPDYDRDLIRKTIEEVTHYEDAWSNWFSREGLDPYRITYDELATDPETVLADLITHLGFDGAVAKGIPLPVAKLADKVSEEWKTRYLLDEGLNDTRAK
ncbi:Stf0 family sulfotransferase [Roseibium porphyridii]|uniref:Stf0 family sulfotransferase n=1 Tax=Roseibium porphyridii TaxID=2866279 RepID=A0ABY8F020_9HYPH|nr:Stf0 family sulfotransferase [Roseibium sp. KMA01]WFE88735.1 Stf0 family sulfotransferase [Roseibium sp. KMA01]